MEHKYYQKHKERLWKEASKKDQNLSDKEKTKGKKRSEKDIKIFLQNKSKTTWVHEKLLFST